MSDDTPQFQPQQPRKELFPKYWYERLGWAGLAFFVAVAIILYATNSLHALEFGLWPHGAFFGAMALAEGFRAVWRGYDIFKNDDSNAVKAKDFLTSFIPSLTIFFLCSAGAILSGLVTSAKFGKVADALTEIGKANPIGFIALNVLLTAGAIAFLYDSIKSWNKTSYNTKEGVVPESNLKSAGVLSVFSVGVVASIICTNFWSVAWLGVATVAGLFFVSYPFLFPTAMSADAAKQQGGYTSVSTDPDGSAPDLAQSKVRPGDAHSPTPAPAAVVKDSDAAPFTLPRHPQGKVDGEAPQAETGAAAQDSVRKAQ